MLHSEELIESSISLVNSSLDLDELSEMRFLDGCDGTQEGGTPSKTDGGHDGAVVPFLFTTRLGKFDGQCSMQIRLLSFHTNLSFGKHRIHVLRSSISFGKRKTFTSLLLTPLGGS